MSSDLFRRQCDGGTVVQKLYRYDSPWPQTLDKRIEIEQTFRPTKKLKFNSIHLLNQSFIIHMNFAQRRWNCIADGVLGNVLVVDFFYHILFVRFSANIAVRLCFTNAYIMLRPSKNTLVWADIAIRTQYSVVIFATLVAFLTTWCVSLRCKLIVKFIIWTAVSVCQVRHMLA